MLCRKAKEMGKRKKKRKKPIKGLPGDDSLGHQ
jgi:hypothetical protein